MKPDPQKIIHSDKLDWLSNENIRPYVFVRKNNWRDSSAHSFDLDWFPTEPLYLNPLLMDEVYFANQILKLENAAFQSASLEMERWVFFDCAIMPGVVVGFAQKTKSLPPHLAQLLKADIAHEWTPLSLFIIIPAIASGEWVAFDLCSVNSILPKSERMYGLGFLSKAFGLWNFNVDICCGIAQWNSPALRLHSHYGAFEILTAYTPVHTYPNTITYRLTVDPQYWAMFFNKSIKIDFHNQYESAGFKVHPVDEKSLIGLQRLIEANEGPFFLDSKEIREAPIGAPLEVYKYKTEKSPA